MNKVFIHIDVTYLRDTIAELKKGSVSRFVYKILLYKACATFFRQMSTNHLCKRNEALLEKAIMHIGRSINN